MKISVIVPIGDREAYKRCRAALDASIAAAGDGVQWELVEVFDDGRRGVAPARNEGLSRATGDWIAWVDCDDEVLPRWAGAVAEGLRAIGEKGGADVLCHGAEIVRDGARASVVRYSDDVREVPARRCLCDILRDIGGSTWLWNKVFRRSLFDGLSFEGVTQEDFRIMPRVLSRARNVVSLPDVLYRYVRPHGSLTHGGGGERNAQGVADAIADGLSDVPDASAILPAWREGCVLRAADCIVRGAGGSALRAFVRRGLRLVLADPRQPLRIKLKCVLAAAGIAARRTPRMGRPSGPSAPERGEGAKRILHISAGWQPWNGAANIARMIMREQTSNGHEVASATWASPSRLRAADEVWIHCAWMPCLWWASLWGRNVRRMPEASYDPVRLAYHGWKKHLAGPLERWSLRRAAAAVATCGAEAEWIRRYEPRTRRVEVTDVGRFFRLDREGDPSPARRPLHVMYLGRRHPLKGVEFLESAVARVLSSVPGSVELRAVSGVFGEDKERAWEWCDVLALPTLSDNFGLVVAEALERGRRVVTTDGAPAWDPGAGEASEEDGGISVGFGGRLLYLRGFRDGRPEARVRLLVRALERILS